MSIVDPDITGGAAPPEDDGGAVEGAAYCPHCSAPVGDGVFPWPPDPTRCPACGQWIGRNRAASAPFDAAAAAAAAPEAGHGEAENGDADEERHRSRAMSFLRGRHSDEPDEEAPPPAADASEGNGDTGGEAWAPDTFEVDGPDERSDQALDEEPPPAGDEEPAATPAAAAGDEPIEPAAAPPPSAEARVSSTEARKVRRRSGGIAGRVRGIRSRVTDELFPRVGDADPAALAEQAPPAAAEREEPTALQPPDAPPPPVADDPVAEPDFDAEPAVAEPVAGEDLEPPAPQDWAPPAAEDAVPEPEAAGHEELEYEDEDEPTAAQIDEPAADEDELAAEAGLLAAEAREEDELEADEEPAAPALEEEPEPAVAEEPVAADEDEYEDEYEDEPVAADEEDEHEPATTAGAATGGEPDVRSVVAHLAVARLAAGAGAKGSRRSGLPIPQKLPSPRISRPRGRPAPPRRAASQRRPAPKPSPIAEGAKRKRRRSPTRITGITMVVVGVLILAYGTVTLVWQDPWTAWQAARAQKKAKVQYQKIVKDFRKSAATQTKVATRDWLHRQAALFNLNTPEGQPVGRLSIPKIGIHFTIVQGTDETTLQKGPAHYVETPLPGAKGKWTVGIAGHRTTYLAPFRHIDQLDPGDKVYISMPYARFYYSVEKTKIVPAADQSALAADNNITDRKPYNRLALTACHPPFSAAERIIVYSRLMHYKINGAHS